METGNSFHSSQGQRKLRLLDSLNPIAEQVLPGWESTDVVYWRNGSISHPTPPIPARKRAGARPSRIAIQEAPGKVRGSLSIPTHGRTPPGRLPHPGETAHFCRDRQLVSL